MRKSLLILTVALLASTAYAQTFYYQSVMPDGRVVIGDKPAPGAKTVKQIPLRAGNISEPLSTPAAPGTTPATGSAQGLDVDAEVRSAQQELDAAKAALEAGREPQPAERIGTAKGASRLNDAYFQRVRALEDAVANAQKRLDEALSQRKAVR